MKMFKSVLTAQEILAQQKKSTPALAYKRIPLPDCAAPWEEVTGNQ